MAAEGLYLLAVNDDDDNNNDKNDSTDMIAPITPTAVLSSDTQTITGKTEAKAKIEIKDSTGKVIATGQADQDGNYTVKLNEPLVNGSKVAVSAIDSAGNVSKSTVVTGTKDTIAPDSPLAQLNQDGTIVTGKAEANAKIEVKSADGQTTIGSGTVGADGKFSLSLSPALTDKNIAKIYIIDSSGNRSEPTDVFGAKDTIAPTKPLLQTVMDDIGAVKGAVSSGGSTDDTKPTLSGIGEAKAVLTIFDNGYPIGTVTVGDNGKWSYTVTNDLVLGSHKITLTQTDVAGNTSELSDAFNFTIVAPAQPSALMLSDSLIIEEVQTSFVDSVNLDRLLRAPNISDSFVDEEQLSIPLEHLLSAEKLETDVIDQLLNEFDLNLVSQNSLLGTVETISVQTDLAETSFKELFNDLDVSSNWMF